MMCAAFGFAGWLRWQLGIGESGASVQPEVVDRTFVIMLALAAAGVAGLVAVLGLRRRAGVGAWAPRVALVAATLVGVVASDLLVGSFYPPPSISDSMFMPHATRGWCFRRRATGTAAGISFTSNSLGLRNPEVPSIKPAKEIRVLCLGDSVAFGYGIRQGETWVEHAERVLAKSTGRKRVRFVNAGISGYATWQEVALARDLDRAIKPDLVLLQFCYNDVLDMTNVEHGMMSGSQMQFLTVESHHWSGWVRAIQTTLARREAERIRRGHLWAGKSTFTEGAGALDRGASLYVEPPPGPILEGWRKALQSLDELKAHCRERKRDLMIVYIPVLAQLQIDGRALAPQSRLAEWAKQAGVDFLDVTDDMVRACGDQEPDGGLMADDVHPGMIGCRIIGDRVAEAVGRWLATAPSAGGPSSRP